MSPTGATRQGKEKSGDNTAIRPFHVSVHLQQPADQHVCSHNDRRIGSANDRARGGPVCEGRSVPVGESRFFYRPSRRSEVN